MKMKKSAIKKKIKYKFKFRKNIKKKVKSKLLIKLFLILFLIAMYIYLYINNEYEDKKLIDKDSAFLEIVSFENNLNLSLKTFDDFRNINSANKLLEENKKFKKSENPDVSIIITIFNQAYDLYKCLRSIQNQSIKNIEIIIVDDCSLDNSLDIIKEFQKDDERIILISHDANKGTIKSRTDGIRKAEGKYITIVDGDDALIHKDILKNCLYIAQKANLDVVEFRAGKYVNGNYRGLVYDYNPLNVTNNIIYQPELREKFIIKKQYNRYYILNRVIWGKFVKKEIFKNALNYIGSEFVDDFISDAEDTIMAVGIYHTASSYFVTKELGYYYNFNLYKKGIKIVNTKCKFSGKPKQFGYYNLIKFLVDKHNKTENEKKKSYHEFLQFNRNIIFGMNLDKKQFQIIFYILNKFLEWDCIKHEEKNNIINFKNKVIEKCRNENITLF